jgi:diguanylate cyclase (GGDEF)-like protein
VIARLDVECRARLAALSAWLVVAATIIAGFTHGTDWPVAIAALVTAGLAPLLLASVRVGGSVGILSGLLVAAWLLLGDGAPLTALGIGSSVCVTALAALLVSTSPEPLDTGSPHRERPAFPGPTHLPPGVADEVLIERLTFHEMTRARRYERSMTLLLIGVEGWPAICAARGRQNAYELLGTLAVRIRRLLRDVDAIGPHGDGMLAILLPETPLDGAHVVASRIERVTQDELGVQVRVGSSLFPEDASTVEGLFQEATAALDLAHLEQVTAAERVRLD